jgi:hypothetical protein
MARAKKHAPKVEELRPSVEGAAKNLVEKLDGPHGPARGAKLTEIEDALLEIRDVLTEKMLDLSLAQQAAAADRGPPPYRHCPGCHQPLPCDATNPRILRTRAGEAQWAEPEGPCGRCRRALFPSVQEPGRRSV